MVRGVEEGRADIGVCWDAVGSARPADISAIIATISPWSCIPAIHLPRRRSVSFEDTIDYEHVDIVARSIMKTSQRSAAAAAGKQMRYRIQVSTVDAAYRIVAANLAVAIVPREEASAIQQSLGLKVVPLSNAWARRQFVISVRDTALSVPAQLLVDSLRKSASKPERVSAREHRI